MYAARTTAAAQGFVEWRVTSVFDEWRVTPVFERLRVTLGVSIGCSKALFVRATGPTLSLSLSLSLSPNQTLAKP